MSTPPPDFSPVTQVLNAGAQPAPPEQKVSEEQFNSMHASSVTYRDLLIFEERLKLNLTRLKKRQQKYEAFLGSLIVVIAYCAFATFYKPSQTYYIHLLHKFFLLLSATTMFLFFATGMYSEKLGHSLKFVPQCNRVLRTFNMHFNRDNRPELSFFRKVPKKFQEGFTAYKASYFKRKSEKRAAALAAKAAGGASSGATMSRSAIGQGGRRLQPSSRGRRIPGGGGGGSASGSDSGARPIMGLSSLTRPPIRPNSNSVTSATSVASSIGSDRGSNATALGNSRHRSELTNRY
ncbi:Spo7-like protein-domain-containing protein [Gamsiella multidivaricata]|uniref:Spo7-like protein-domain-containing protein n=1 Tax=Gamsiella multidivaricata TaxID=101098 RepID=UPI00221E76C9|nr:Spo7-like protein-domain-containing protein [Gamsiella multidivaricata]KAI7827580.1 Spo7-like protein-domain-containing protein [Gamsiella multidivaricata]